MSTSREIVAKVANILEQNKVSWARAIQVCNQCLTDGFTEDDIIEAATNMRAGDRKYWSIYSVFIKTDYWMTQKSEQSPKGIW